MKIAGLTVGLALLLVGCAAVQDKVLVATSTILGFELAQNPATGMYQGRFGYARAEFTLVPTNGVDVLTEIQFNNLMNGGGLYQRMAVGDEAVKQPGAALLFAKGVNGNLDAQAIAAVQNVPTVSRSVIEAQAPLAKAFGAAADKSPFNAVALRHGYPDFAAFILDHAVTLDKVNAIATELKGLGLAP